MVHGTSYCPGKNRNVNIAHAQVDPKKLGASSFNSHHRIGCYQKVSLKKISCTRVNRENVVVQNFCTNLAMRWLNGILLFHMNISKLIYCITKQHT